MKENFDQFELIKKIMLTFLGGVITVTLIFPLLLKLKFIQGFFESTSIELFAGITAIILAILLFSWENMNRYWKKYRETKETGNFPLVSVEIIGLYFITTGVLAFLKSFFIPGKDIAPSSEFITFMVINGILFFAWFFISFFYKKKTSQPIVNVDSQINLDEPIMSPKQDILRRGKFVDDLNKIILELPFELTGSFTIGLNGSWGEGKTSVINLLIDKLRESPDFDRNFLLIRFDPWNFGDEKAILNAFYDRLEKEFSEKFIFPGLKKSIARYFKLISTGVSFTGIKLDIRFSDLSIEQMKNQIESYIAKAKRKLFIIIDDIDRLQPDEMALVFKLVRQNSNFKNTLFLLSFDQSIVTKVLKNNFYLDGDFLDKIINMPIPLPAIEQSSIDDFLLENIEKLLKKKGIPEDEIKLLLEEFPEIYKSGIASLFKTLRITKRYLNSLFSTLPSIKPEVNPRDFLILEMVKIFNNDLYKNIYKNQRLFAPSMIEQLYLEAELKPKGLRNQTNRIKSLQEKYESLMGSDNQKEIFVNLLKLLFPGTFERIWSGHQPDFSDIGKNRDKKQIANPDCFLKYFLLQVPFQEISDEQIKAMISVLKSMQREEQEAAIKEEMFKKDIEAWPSKLMQKLMDFIDEIDSQLALNISEVIYKNAEKFSRGQNFYLSSDFTKAAQSMIFLIENKIGEQSKSKVLEEAILSTPDLLFSTLIIRLCRQRGVMGEQIANSYSLDLKPFQDKVAQRLKEYFIDDKRDIFEVYKNSEEWSFILNEWYIYWKHDWPKNAISDYVRSLVKNDVRKFINFLDKMVDRDNDNINVEPKFLFKTFAERFNADAFREVAKKFKSNESLSMEEKEILSKFLRVFFLHAPMVI